MEMHPQICLGLDLNPQLDTDLSSNLPEGLRLDNLPPQRVIEYLEQEKSTHDKGLLFVPVSVWDTLSPQIHESVMQHQAWQFILIADQQSRNILEYMASGQFLTILTCPLNAEKISRALDQAEEVSTLYQDIFMMAREISLERELLARKNEQLSFLNQILTKASQSLDPAVIISSCTEDLTMLLEVKVMMGVFWSANEAAWEAEIFLPDKYCGELQNAWINHLLGVAKRFSGEEMTGYQLTTLPNRSAQGDSRPEFDQLITQPLKIEQQTFGALVICSGDAKSLGQDKIRILTSATNHLALALRNSLEYRKVRARADHDGLTRIANRQNFDSRLREEMKRHQRHSQELSLLMLDLDYFKSVNDTYGHLAGDMVLQEVGKILVKTLRESDFPARFGGEEFVVILPHTREEQAWMLAERIRTIIAQTTFRFEHKHFRVTASLGIAGLKPGALSPPEHLIHNADQALYRAKTSGRNMVCSSSVEETSHIQ